MTLGLLPLISLLNLFILARGTIDPRKRNIDFMILILYFKEDFEIILARYDKIHGIG